MSNTRASLLTEFYTLWSSAVSNLPVEIQVESYGWIPDYGTGGVRIAILQT
jgi:hypothetical protein